MGNGRNAILAALTLLSGCIGAPDLTGYEQASSGLVEVPPSTVPLPLVDADGEDWQTATVGCEDLLDETLTLRLASASAGLVAAVDGEGHIVCVDTLEAIQEELESLGESDRADALRDQFLLAVGLGVPPNPLHWAMGDPTPQPNMELSAGADTMSGTNRDPTPQPNKSH